MKTVPGPIFLMSSERSGSNLITRIFNSHSQYCAPPAVHLLRVLGENLFRYGDLRNARNWSTLVEDCVELFDSKIGIWTIATPDAERIAAKCAPGSLGTLVLSLYRAEADAAGKASFFVKENELYSVAPIVLEACPTARFIHLVRDPRDMALSWLKAAALRGGPVRAAAVWTVDQRGFLTLSSQIAATRHVARLTYEELTGDADRVLERVCAGLRIGYEPDMLAFHRSESAITNAKVAVDLRNTARPLMTGNSGKHKTELRADQIAFIEATCGDLMGVFGYSASAETVDDLAALAERLKEQEPFEKAAYQTASTEERERRAQWQAVVARIRERAPR